MSEVEQQCKTCESLNMTDLKEALADARRDGEAARSLKDVWMTMAKDIWSADSTESAESAEEQAYLVSRGVRPLALLGTCDLDETVMADRFVWLNRLAAKYGVLPFVLPRKDFPCAMTGFAAAAWVVDLLAWSYEQPLRQHHRIIGLLLGYSVDAIAGHDDREFAGKPITVDDQR